MRTNWHWAPLLAIMISLSTPVSGESTADLVIVNKAKRELLLIRPVCKLLNANCLNAQFRLA